MFQLSLAKKHGCLIGFWDSTAQKPCFILADDLPKYFFNIYLAREILDNSTGPQRLV